MSGLKTDIVSPELRAKLESLRMDASVKNIDEKLDEVKLIVIDMTSIGKPEVKIFGKWENKWITVAQRMMRKAYEKYRAAEWRKYRKEHDKQ